MILTIELGNRHFHLGGIAANGCFGLASILCMSASHTDVGSSVSIDQTLAKTSGLPRSLDYASS